MDSGSYNHIRRGAMPSSSLSPSTPTYKTNVNRTKTRKWVEAKMQSYDGDDWGNDYDEYDDGDEQGDEPEPPPKPTGSRRPGQTGHQLPSSRTFPQSAPYGQPPSRNPGGSPPLQVQTQQTASRTASPPYAPRPVYSEPPFAPVTVSGSPNANFSASSQSAGPASTPSRFPPRKSSMGQQDRPEIPDKIIATSHSPAAPNSSSSPYADQRSSSPSVAAAAATTAAAKPLPFVRPADIYKRMEEEKDRERLSLDSSRPSMDSLPGRTEATTSSAQLRSSHEQHRRTSFESREGSESARGPKSTLAPVAERKSEYGIEGLLADARPDDRALVSELGHSGAERSELSPSASEFGDNVKEDLLKARRFSTSPQLPNLTRVSGFGVDFFSDASNFSSTTSLNPPTPSSEPPRLPTETSGAITAAGTAHQARKQNASAIEDRDPASEQDASLGTMNVKESTSKFDRRPVLPGAWVTESSIVPTSEQPTQLQRERAEEVVVSATANSNIMTQSNEGQNDGKVLAVNQPSQPLVEASDNIRAGDAATQSNSSDLIKDTGYPDGQPQDAEAPRTSGALATEGYLRTPLSSQPMEEEDKSLQPQPPASQAPIATDALPFPSPAPLNPSRADGDLHETGLPSIRQRNATVSTVDSVAPGKVLESDKLREEIIKSLSPAPASPARSDSSNQSEGGREPVPGNLTRESTYLAGVYDDYLSPTEDKSLQEVSREAKMSNQTAPSQAAEPEQPNVVSDASGSGLNLSTSQQAAHDSTKIPASGDASRPRRFSWQQSADEEILNPTTPALAMPVYSQDTRQYSQLVFSPVENNKPSVVSPVSDLLQADGGESVPISHQVSQVSSRAPGEASLSAIEPPSPVSFMPTKSPQLAVDGPNTSSLSLADEKEKVLIGDAQSTASSIAEQHPALVKDMDPHGHGISVAEPAPGVTPSHTGPVPATFREILNLGSCEQRINKFDETREQFYAMDSGLSSWLAHLQDEPEHSNAAAITTAQVFTSKPTLPASPSGAPFIASKIGALGSQPRRASMGNVQQLMGGQSGGNFNASGNQVGTKSKEFLHAAGAFGNKGVKSGMKLFNKGKSKLRERTGGDKTFF